jgi:hypothetical protein
MNVVSQAGAFVNREAAQPLRVANDPLGPFLISQRFQRYSILVRTNEFSTFVQVR